MDDVHPRMPWSFVALVAWTGFVWIGRIRNALADDSLTGWDRAAPILLSATFLVSAAVLAVRWFVEVRRGVLPSRGLRAGVVVFCCWTVGVWLVRGADIAFAGDHDAGFVVVHSVLALVSIALAVAVAASPVLRSPAGRGSPSVTSV